LKFGQTAMAISEKVDGFGSLPATAWALALKDGIDDPALHRRIDACRDFAEVKAVAEKRVDELMARYDALSAIEKTCPQAKDVLRQENADTARERNRIQSDLSDQLKACGPALPRALSDHMISRGSYYDLAPTLSELSGQKLVRD
jgi:hypothetical protein